jgi:hypothetical protein
MVLPRVVGRIIVFIAGRVFNMNNVFGVLLVSKEDLMMIVVVIVVVVVGCCCRNEKMEGTN